MTCSFHFCTILAFLKNGISHITRRGVWVIRHSTLTGATRGETLTPKPNECNSILTSGTNNIYPNPYIDVNDLGHRFRSGSPLTNYPHATTSIGCKSGEFGLDTLSKTETSKPCIISKHGLVIHKFNILQS